MPLYEKIEKDFKSALKAKDSIRVSVLRLVRSALKNKEVDVRRKLEQDEIARVIATQVKQHKDSIEQYNKGGRTDLAEKEQQELEILEEYLPQQLGSDELEAILKEVIAEVGASSMKDIGRVMKITMHRVGGDADGKIVNQMARTILSA